MKMFTLAMIAVTCLGSAAVAQQRPYYLPPPPPVYVPHQPYFIPPSPPPILAPVNPITTTTCNRVGQSIICNTW